MSGHYPRCDKETIVHQLVEVEARVTVLPLVRPGKPKVFCIDSYIREDCATDEEKRKDYYESYDSRKRCGKEKQFCTFTVTQVICVEIPITIGADVDVDSGIARCGIADIGPCICLDTEKHTHDDEHEDTKDKTKSEA
ncbi:MAG: hypothetical protein ACOX2Q_07065 [Dehalobacterium sp.]|jgi:hypothetical protein